MSKYIDAEKLIAEIERYENTAIDAYNPHGEDADFWHGKVVACEDLKTLVTSLQQEHPQVADASKMERLNVDDLHDWSTKFAPGFREMIEATAYHFWNLAICSMKEK